MEGEDRALALNSVEGRVPFDRLAHAGDGAHDDRVEAAADVLLPARHSGDVGIDGGVALGFGDLRIAACEKGWLRGGPLSGRLVAAASRPWRLLGRFASHYVRSRTAGAFDGFSAVWFTSYCMG